MFSHVDCVCVCLFPLYLPDKELGEPLQVSQPAAAKLLTKSKNTAMLHQSLDPYTGHQSIFVKIPVFTFRALHGQAPAYIWDQLQT